MAIGLFISWVCVVFVILMNGEWFCTLHCLNAKSIK